MHPSVQRAGVVNSIAIALAGGPRYQTSVDATTGEVTRTQIPMSRKDIGMAIALEAISGALAGYGVKPGPGVVGRAGFAGLQQGQQVAQQRQQQNADESAQAQADAKSVSDAYARKASIADLNAKTLLSTAEGESKGADTLAKIAATNKQLIDDYEDQGALFGRGVTQAELIEGMQTGRFNSTEMLGPIDGYRLIGNGKVEATHAVISDPGALVPLTQEQVDGYIANHVQGFPKGMKIGDSVKVPGIQIARANQQKILFMLAQQRHDEVADTLAHSDDPKVQALAAKVPSIGSLLDDPKTRPGLTTALTRFASYTSHAEISHGGRDLYESLQAMAQPSMQDPNDPKKTIPNRNAPFANQVADAFGGWPLLAAYHDEIAPLEIKNEAAAADMMASSEPGSRAYQYAQRWQAATNTAKAAQASAAARAREAAKPSTEASADTLRTPDALGYVPTAPSVKEYDKRFNAFKKNADDLSKTEQTYAQFQDTLRDINAGRDLTGAASVVALFNAIGLSGTALKGQGFRVNQNVIQEHAQARGWLGSVQQKVLNAKAGDIITPNQIRDYASIAANARLNQYVALVNEAHNAGLAADAFLPTGNGQKIDPNTAQIFFSLTGNDPNKARAAATKKGWAF